MKALYVYLLLCLVATGFIGGLGVIGIPAKVEASENLLFFCLGFIVPAIFVMLDDQPGERIS